jgi:CheY-like chemotaxis protein
MLDQNDLKWIASTSTDLNSVLQQVSRYADLARRHKGEHNYIDLMGERVELAAKTAQALFDRVTSRIIGAPSRNFAQQKGPTLSVLPSPRVAARESRVSSVNATIRPGKSGGTATLELPSSTVIKNPQGNREYILLIEDEPEVAELAAEMLAEEGYRVVIAHDGFEALKIYQSAGKQIGLVILDFFLPVMDGDAVFDELRSINPKVNVVLSSGFAEQSKIASMLSQGLRGFIPKPYGREKLLEQVRSTLDAARQTSR